MDFSLYRLLGVDAGLGKQAREVAHGVAAACRGCCGAVWDLAELRGAALCVGRGLEGARGRGGICCFPAGRREKVSLREGMVLAATGSRCLSWGSIETVRKLSSLPSAGFKIAFFFFLISFLQWQ